MVLKGISHRKVPTVHVLPGTIDLERFKNALSDTLQIYPHAAGHIRCQDGRWSVGSFLYGLLHPSVHRFLR